MLGDRPRGAHSVGRPAGGGDPGPTVMVRPSLLSTTASTVFVDHGVDFHPTAEGLDVDLGPDGETVVARPNRLREAVGIGSHGPDRTAGRVRPRASIAGPRTGPKPPARFDDKSGSAPQRYPPRYVQGAKIRRTGRNGCSTLFLSHQTEWLQLWLSRKAPRFRSFVHDIATIESSVVSMGGRGAHHECGKWGKWAWSRPSALRQWAEGNWLPWGRAAMARATQSGRFADGAFPNPGRAGGRGPAPGLLPSPGAAPVVRARLRWTVAWVAIGGHRRPPDPDPDPRVAVRRAQSTEQPSSTERAGPAPPILRLLGPIDLACARPEPLTSQQLSLVDLPGLLSVRLGPTCPGRGACGTAPRSRSVA